MSKQKIEKRFKKLEADLGHGSGVQRDRLPQRRGGMTASTKGKRR